VEGEGITQQRIMEYATARDEIKREALK